MSEEKMKAQAGILGTILLVCTGAGFLSFSLASGRPILQPSGVKGIYASGRAQATPSPTPSPTPIASPTPSPTATPVPEPEPAPNPTPSPKLDQSRSPGLVAMQGDERALLLASASRKACHFSD